MLWRGFRFGMMLQLAVGPICLLTFMASASFGWASGEAVAIAATIVDAVYIIVSASSVAVIIKKPEVQRKVKIFGAVILVLFGGYMVWQTTGGNIPHVAVAGTGAADFFIEGIVLTVSNPLTILFWGGVFAAQAAEYSMDQQEMKWFAGGCLLSTIVFLSLIAAAGVFVGQFLPSFVLLLLNGAVGIALIYFGMRLWR